MRVPRTSRHFVLATLAAAWLIAAALHSHRRDLGWLQYLSVDVSWLQGLLLLVGIYGVVLLLVGLARRSPPPRPSARRPFVSIVVPAKDEEAVIEATVHSLCTLDYADEQGGSQFEVIVVDDQSTDQTAAILRRLEGELPVRIVRTPAGSVGKAAALNLGSAQARGDFIAVFDADARVAPDFLQLMVPWLDEESVGGVQSRRLVYNGSQNQLTRRQDDESRVFVHALQQARQALGGMVSFVGNGLLVRRAALDEVGGWNEDALTEDLDLSARFHLAGWDIRYCGDAVVWEEAVSTLRQYIRQRVRWVEGAIGCLGDYLPAILFSRTGPFKRLDMIVFFAASSIVTLGVATTYVYAVTRLFGEVVLFVRLPQWLTTWVSLAGTAGLLVAALAAARWRVLTAATVVARLAAFSLLTPAIVPMAIHRYVRRALTGDLSWEKTAHGGSGPARDWPGGPVRAEDEAYHIRSE